MEGDRAEGAIGLWLGKDAGDGVVGGVGFKDGGKGGIEVDKDGSGGEGVFEEHGGVGVGRPVKRSVFVS